MKKIFATLLLLATIVPASVSAGAIPTKPVGVYWEAYYTVGGNPMRHITAFPNPTDNPSGYINVIHLFQALPTTPTGAVYFDPTFSDANIISDIATVRARGQIVLLTVGGAGAQVDITSQAKADAFIASIKNINVQLGGSGTTAAFDGVDYNSYEGSPASGQWLTYASLALKDYYGSDFSIASPPAVHGQSCPSGQACLDRLTLAEMHAGGTYGSYTGTALDWFSPQFYDGGGNNVCSTVQSTLDFYNTAVTVPLHNGNATASQQIPRTKIGIGYAISSASTWWTTANAASCYTAVVDAGKTPRGGFNFSAGNNPTDTFATEVGPTILGSAGGAGTLTTVKRINGILTASVKTILGKAVATVKSFNGKQ